MIQCSDVGHFGRWGNSLHEFCGAKACAEQIGVEYQIPADWIGRKVFNISEASITEPLPTINEDEWDGQDGYDIKGYFQAKKHIDRLSRSKLKEWLKPQKEVKGPRIAIHLRRSDYVGNGHYAIVSDASYERALEENGYDVNEAKIYRCDSPSDQYQDFLEIMNAEVIFRSNSTFSWWAATLSNARVFSPVVGNLSGEQDVKFIEGNWPKLMHLFSDLHLKD